MNYVGIDYDTFYVHLVRLPDNPGIPSYHPVHLPGADAFTRLRAVRMEMPGPGFWEDVIGAGIEEPGGKYAVPKLKAVQGAIISCLPDDLLVVEYHAARWKKLTGLNPHATKDEIKTWVLERLGENPQWPQDAYDAYCLAYVTAQQTSIMRGAE